MRAFITNLTLSHKTISKIKQTKFYKFFEHTNLLQKFKFQIKYLYFFLKISQQKFISSIQRIPSVNFNEFAAWHCSIIFALIILAGMFISQRLTRGNELAMAYGL
jgi:hypothetical protein